MNSSILKTIFIENSAIKVDTTRCLTIYYQKQGYNAIKAALFAENNLLNFVEFVNTAIRNAKNLNIPYIFSLASKEIVCFDKSYFLIKEIHEKLLQIDWREFENISGVLLEVCFGAIEVKVTQATADGGLDFSGRLPIFSNLSPKIYGYVEVYGQSKKYTGNVGIYDIKSFVAFANSKKRNYVHPPQIFIFFTTADYAQNSLKEIEENGFIALSGFQIATLIYNHEDELKNKSETIKRLVKNITPQ
jgi:hypothetical protein